MTRRSGIVVDVPPVQLDLGTTAPPRYGSLADAPLMPVSDIAKCAGHPVVFDCETTGLNWWRHRVVGVAFWCPNAGVAGYVVTENAAAVAAVKECILAWPSDTLVINHNLKFDLQFMGIDPLDAPWDYLDTLVMAHIQDSRGAPRADGKWDNPLEERGSLSLARLSEHHLRDSAKAAHRAAAPTKGNATLPHHQWPLAQLSRYAVDDARLTYALCGVLMPLLREYGQIPLLRVAMRYLGVLWRAERRGLWLDVAEVGVIKLKVAAHLETLNAQLQQTIGVKFDWHSTQQLSWALYDVYGHRKPVLADGRRGLKVTGTATSSEVLLKLARHPLAAHIVQMRGLDKTRQFFDQWLEYKDNDGFIHQTLNQTNVRTGRLSSSEPNLQQIPGDERSAAALDAFEDVAELQEFYASMQMRKIFRAPEGSAYLALDYKQQEVRMFAVLAGDPAMLAAVTSGGDLHAQMAFQIWGERTNPWRDWAKTVSLGLMYGRGEENLAAAIGPDATMIISDYHARFRGVRRMRRQVREQMLRSGYVSYWSGRRYYRNDESGYHKAVNALVQGGSADFLMHAAVGLHDWLSAEGLPAKIVNFVHDELDLEIAPDALSELAPQIAERMQRPDLLGVPFLTDLKAGRSLGELEPIPLP